MKIQINITKEVLKESMMCPRPHHTDAKIAKVGQNCAIGKAIFDLFGSISWVTIETIQLYKDADSVFIGNHLNGDFDYSIKLPLSAIKFIQQFDNLSPEQRINLPELSFEIEVPEEVIELIGINEVHRVLSESKTLQLVG